MNFTKQELQDIDSDFLFFANRCEMALEAEVGKEVAVNGIDADWWESFCENLSVDEALAKVLADDN